MKKLFILVLMALVAFFALTGLNAAQEKRLMDKASPKLMSGKVTQADEKTKSVTIIWEDGKEVTVNFSDAKVGACKGGRRLSAPKTTLPKVGDNVVARAGGDCPGGIDCGECLAVC